jgi:cell wall-associated NlpC family hydrolase
MKKFAVILGLAVLIESAFAMDAHALRTAHRPWLARHPGTSPVYLEPDRTSLSARSSQREKAHVFGHTPQGEKIVQQANRYRGVKYRFGGDSKSKGFDCSGLVKRIYNDLHLDKVPRTAGGLYKMGKPIHLNELRPGDLVFFKNTYRRGISHVGVYAGGNRFIHAQNRRHGVTITALSEPYYQLHYAGARRLY